MARWGPALPFARRCAHRTEWLVPPAQTGLEPRKLFNVVEFMMHDKDSSGTIDMDECMEILFRRFGKDQLEERTNGACAHGVSVGRGCHTAWRARKWGVSDTRLGVHAVGCSRRPHASLVVAPARTAERRRTQLRRGGSGDGGRRRVARRVPLRGESLRPLRPRQLECARGRLKPFAAPLARRVFQARHRRRQRHLIHRVPEANELHPAEAARCG